MNGISTSFSDSTSSHLPSLTYDMFTEKKPATGSFKKPVTGSF